MVQVKSVRVRMAGASHHWLQDWGRLAESCERRSRFSVARGL